MSKAYEYLTPDGSKVNKKANVGISIATGTTTIQANRDLAAFFMPGAKRETEGCAKIKRKGCRILYKNGCKTSLANLRIRFMSSNFLHLHDNYILISYKYQYLYAYCSLVAPMDVEEAHTEVRASGAWK
jgi:hypothetical protein